MLEWAGGGDGFNRGAIVGLDKKLRGEPLNEEGDNACDRCDKDAEHQS